MSDEELAALAEAAAENSEESELTELEFDQEPDTEVNRDIVTEDLNQIVYTNEEDELKIKQEEERHEMQ